MNHFLRSKENKMEEDLIFFQGTITKDCLFFKKREKEQKKEKKKAFWAHFSKWKDILIFFKNLQENM